VFPETIIHGIVGYRCRTIDQFEFAARNIDKISRKRCREWALNYSLDAVYPRYKEWFDMLIILHTKDESGNKKGYYTRDPGRKELDWLNIDYPSY
jgi:hypothetical protein